MENALLTHFARYLPLEKPVLNILCHARSVSKKHLDL